MFDIDLLLIRKWFTLRSTIGELFFIDDYLTQYNAETNQVFAPRFCYILEDVARPSDVKIPKETCIPPGDYSVRCTMSPRFKRVLPLIYNVAFEDIDGVKNWNIIRHGKHIWTGVRIHKGNVDADTDACQLPGLSKSKDRVSNSEDAFDPLFEKIFNKIGTNGTMRYRIIHQQET